MSVHIVNDEILPNAFDPFPDLFRSIYGYTQPVLRAFTFGCCPLSIAWETSERPLRALFHGCSGGTSPPSLRASFFRFAVRAEQVIVGVAG